MEVIGRERELSRLASAWQNAETGRPELAVVWGRRRVGKTYLLSHFAGSRRSVYFTATRQDTEERQLERFTERLREQLGESVTDEMTGPFPTWEAALRFVARLARHEPLLVVIDEAPRLSSTAGDFGDVVSAVWENHVRDQKLMLVLSGSAVAVIEEMLGPRGGMHRRPTVELRMDPFSFREAVAFLPELDGEDFLQAYAACGGYPLHLRRWSPESSVVENLTELAFTPGGLLLGDGPDILSEDLDWRGGYERVLAAMGRGARRRSRIAGRAQQRIDYTLDRLRRAGYVRRVRPIGAEAGDDPQYEIGDDYLAFWFSVLRDDLDLIEGGQGDAVRRRADGRWQTHVARVLESAARAHARSMVDKGELPGDTVVGRWWRDETAEVDVAAIAPDGSPVLVGECKWSSKPISVRELSELRRKAALIGGSAEPIYAFWSRGGAAQLAADYPDVWSFTCDDLLP
ncbi:ATP-binding protein [Phytoactinopolyspora halophila]|nr:ATP-binding protein [Phytoactinopolyspora halophila]